MADLEYDVTDAVATITLNRPHRKNAFTLDMIDEWALALRRAGADPTVAAVVLTGAGDAFCAGIDLAELGTIEPTPLARKRMLTEHIYQVLHAATDLDKPLIAAVNGVATGAGLDMALVADIRFVSRSARMAEGYINVGLVPGDGGAYFLPRIVGHANALEMLLGGEFVSAEHALRIGLANRVYDDDELLDKTLEFARHLAGQSPVALRMIKRAVYQSSEMSLRASLDMISSHMAVVQSTHDYDEAQAAFRDKRTPRFTGN